MVSLDWERWLHLLSIVATAALLAKLFYERLSVRYRYFTAYLAWDLAVSIVLSFISPRRNLYGYIYFSTQTVTWVLYVMTALELLTSVLKRYPGIATLGRKIMAFSLGAGILVALASMIFGVNYAPHAQPMTIVAMNLFLLGRIVCVSVLGFLLISAALLLWFPVPLPANSTRFLFGYTLVFTGRTITFLLLNSQGFIAASVASVVSMVVFIACTVYWMFRLNRDGENTDMVVRSISDPAQEQRLIRQMDAINSRLAQTRK